MRGVPLVDGACHERPTRCALPRGQIALVGAEGVKLKFEEGAIIEVRASRAAGTHARERSDVSPGPDCEHGRRDQHVRGEHWRAAPAHR